MQRIPWFTAARREPILILHPRARLPISSRSENRNAPLQVTDRQRYPQRYGFADFGSILEFELEQLAYELYSTRRPFGRQARNLTLFDRDESGKRFSSSDI
jgi:hypothetical protein